MNTNKDKPTKVAVANGKQTPNYAKRDSYALAFRLIDESIKQGFPLQAITIEESILADRLWSTLNVGKDCGGKRETLGAALDVWKKFRKGDSINYAADLLENAPEMESIYESLTNWWADRNKLLHGIVKSFHGEGPVIKADSFENRAVKVAEKGLELANKVKNWVQKQVYHARSNEKKASKA